MLPLFQTLLLCIVYVVTFATEDCVRLSSNADDEVHNTRRLVCRLNPVCRRLGPTDFDPNIVELYEERRGDSMLLASCNVGNDTVMSTRVKVIGHDVLDNCQRNSKLSFGIIVRKRNDEQDVRYRCIMTMREGENNRFIENTYMPTTMNGTYGPYKPVYTTSYPKFPTERPIYTSRVPVYPTEKPVSTTRQPMYPTEKPVYTRKPMYPTEKPVYTARQPMYQTEKPVYTTRQPMFPTEKPVYTTRQPVYPNENPIYTTKQPMNPTEKPVYTTKQPMYPTGKPVYTRQPMYPPEKPVYTARQPMYQTEKPVYTARQPMYQTVKPVYTTRQPVYPNENPIYTTKQPMNPTEKPVYTTRQPMYPTGKPVYTRQPMYQTEKPVYTRQPMYQTGKPVYTRQPMYQTEKPVSTTRQSMYQTEKPVSTARQPMYQTEKSVSTTRQSMYQTENPVSTTRQPVYPTEKPVYTSIDSEHPTERPVYTTSDTENKASVPCVSVSTNIEKKNSLTVECDVHSCQELAQGKLETLEITRTVGEKEIVLAKIEQSQRFSVPLEIKTSLNNFNVSGRLGEGEGSYLRAGWDWQDSYDTGIYRCNLYYKDAQKKRRVLADSHKIESSRELNDFIGQLFHDMDDPLPFDLADKGESYASAKADRYTDGRLNKDMKTYRDNVIDYFFYKPATFGNKTYHLSKEVLTNDVKSDDLCRVIVGGYLAEVDDAQEYDAVAKYIREHEVRGALIGGTDAENVGVWKFRRSGREVPYFMWRKEEPSNTDGKGHCLAILTSYSDLMKDIKCGGSELQYHFVCEEDILGAVIHPL